KLAAFDVQSSPRESEAGDVPARSGEARDQPRSDRTAARCKHDRNGASRLLCCNGAGRTRGHDHIRPQTNQLGRQIRESVVLSFRPSVLNDNIFAVNMTKLAQTPNECVEEMSLQR